MYGNNSQVPFTEDYPLTEPASLYAATKRSNELMAQSYAKLYKFPITALRFFTVYGPYGRPDMALFKFTKKLFDFITLKSFEFIQKIKAILREEIIIFFSF